MISEELKQKNFNLFLTKEKIHILGYAIMNISY